MCEGVGSFIPAWASGRASMQELWGLSSDRVAVNVSRESMKVTSVDTSTESRVIGSISGRGIRKDPGASTAPTYISYYRAYPNASESRAVVCVRGRLPRMIAD